MTKYQKRCLILCKDYKISYPDKGPSFGWTFVEDKNGRKLIKPRGVCGKDYFHHICLVKSILGKPYTMGVLLHEVGHILYKHIEADMEKDFEEVVDIAYRVGYTDKMIQTLQLQFGMFENICMDLEVNSKILTVGDVIKINQYVKETYGKGQICIPSNYKCDVRDKYKDYYEPVLEYMYNQYKNQSRNLDQLMQDMLDYIGQDMRPHQENKDGSQMDLPSEIPNKEVPKEALDQPDDGEDQEDAPELEENGEANCKYKHKGKKNSNGGASEIDESNRGAGGSESDKEETVKDEVKRETGEDLPDEDQSNGEGGGEGGENCYRPDATGGKISENGYVLGYQDPEELLTKFLLKICNNHRDTKYNQNFDSMKHYNKGTRPNKDGLLYTTRKRKISSDQHAKFKLGIVLDISTSQHAINEIFKESLGKVLQIIRNTFKQATLQVWSSSMQGEYDLKKEIPTEIPRGRGTRLGKGIVDLSNKGFDTILMISDLLIINFAEDLEMLDKEKHVDLYVVETMSPCRMHALISTFEELIASAIEDKKDQITLRDTLNLDFFDGENGR